MPNASLCFAPLLVVKRKHTIERSKRERRCSRAEVYKRETERQGDRGSEREERTRENRKRDGERKRETQYKGRETAAGVWRSKFDR